MCEYCKIHKKENIVGKEFEVRKTNTLASKINTDNLRCFILKNECDKKAGIMIGTYEGYHYIDIEFCPMCGRKLNK